MNQRVEQLLAAGESRNVEFKATRQSLSDHVFETVCAFLNRDGGDILLGVTDAGIATGVEPDRLPQIKKDFASAINNPQKLTPPCRMEEDIFRFSLSFVGSAQETLGEISDPVGGETSTGGSEKAATGGSEETADKGSEETGEESLNTLINNCLSDSNGSEETADRGSEETMEKIIGLMRENASISAAEIAQRIDISSRVVERHIAKLKATGRVKRVGPTKNGVWRVLR